jgi:putative Mg2+ transporter-C (MgtC) family protein
MPLQPTWEDIALRLVLTVLAGAAIGLNREARGHAAGFRTTILVGLAASASMIQANLLLSVGGKTPDSFGIMDLMRLPLGILTGVGFIGGGAILKRGDLVLGVTTAATLWIMTVIGLCFGGGQLGLGISTTALAFAVLWALKWLDLVIPREHRAKLAIASHSRFAAPPDLNALIGKTGYQACLLEQISTSEPGGRKLSFEIRWKQAGAGNAPVDLLKLVEANYQIESFELIDQGSH